MHFVAHTKQNILRWKKIGFCHIDVELANIQEQIKKMETADEWQMDAWYGVWLRALYNRGHQYELFSQLCQNQTTLEQSERAQGHL